MSESELKSKPKELNQMEQLVIEGKFEEAHKLIAKITEQGDTTLKDLLSYNLLKIDIMIQQGLYEDAIKLANQTYKESLGLKENLLALDVLNLEIQAMLMLNRLDEAWERIKIEEEILKRIPQESTRDFKRRIAFHNLVKSWFFLNKKDVEESIKHYELCVALLEEIGDNRELAYVLIGGSINYYANLKGELQKASENLKKGLAISKKINWKYGIALGFFSKGVISTLKGDIDHSIKYHKRSLAIFKKFNNKPFIANILNNLSWNYRTLGDLDKALESIELSIKLNNEMGNLFAAAINYDFLIRILIDKCDLESAWNFLEELEQLKNHLNDKQLNLQYLFDKALILKTSSRSRDRIESEDILKEIIKDESIDYETAINSRLILCELLLIELRISNDFSVLDEINSYTVQLLENAERSHSSLLFAEVYFLKAKLSLLTLDLKNARRFLIQAQRIAERFEYNQLAAKISIEHDKLRNQLEIWHDLREEEISLSERIKLAGIDEHMKDLLQKRISITTQVKEEQIIVHKERKICIICKGEISGFIYICDCDALYCEKCARALIDIENVCWVCNIPIEITKSIKPYKKDKIEEKNMKKDEFIPKR